MLTLPLNEMADGQNSPYSALSAMAIDPIYISPAAIPDLAALGGEAILDDEERAALAAVRAAPAIDYRAVRALKSRAFRAASGPAPGIIGVMVAFRRLVQGVVAAVFMMTAAHVANAEAVIPVRFSLIAAAGSPLSSGSLPRSHQFPFVISYSVLGAARRLAGEGGAGGRGGGPASGSTVGGR